MKTTRPSSRPVKVGDRVLVDDPTAGTLDGRVAALLDHWWHGGRLVRQAAVVEFPVAGETAVWETWRTVVDTARLRRTARTAGDDMEVNTRPDVPLLEPFADDGPRCVWLAPAEDPTQRYLTPGCYERVQDPDAECGCPTTAEQLTKTRAELTRARRQVEDGGRLWTALAGLVRALPGGGKAIEEAYRRRHEENRQIKRNRGR